MMKGRWFRRLLLPFVGTAALAFTMIGTSVASAGTTIHVTVGPAPIGSYYVSHVHMHGPDCGHYRVWNDGVWAYYYGGRWEYYTPGDRWAYYRVGYVPVSLRGHVAAARGFHPRAAVAVRAPGKVVVRGAVAPRVHVKASAGPAYRPAVKVRGSASVGHSGSGPGHGGKSGHR
jgi:hypothetical protein